MAIVIALRRTLPCKCDHHYAGSGRVRGRGAPEPAALPDVPADLLRRSLRHQPVDGSDVPVDRPLALRQWSALVEAYRAAGHHVDLLDPDPGPPGHGVRRQRRDSSWTGSCCRPGSPTPQRAPEAAAHAAWHRRNGTATAVRPSPSRRRSTRPRATSPCCPSRILAGYGFRTSRAAHGELAALTGREVISLELVDPRLYHLDVALTVLDDERDHLAYYPDGVQPRQPPAAGRALPGRDHRRPRPTRSPSA